MGDQERRGGGVGEDEGAQAESEVGVVEEKGFGLEAFSGDQMGRKELKLRRTRTRKRLALAQAVEDKNTEKGGVGDASVYVRNREF